jgi:hypothetical protein
MWLPEKRELAADRVGICIGTDIAIPDCYFRKISSNFAPFSEYYN